MKTSDIVELYGLINPSKLTKITDAKAKFAIIKDNQRLKEVADSFGAFRTDALEKLKGEDFDQWQRKAQEWQGRTAGTPDEQKEVGAINAYFQKYQDDVAKCLADESAKEHDIEIEPVGEEAFTQFCDSNDWTVEQTTRLYEALVK